MKKILIIILLLILLVLVGWFYLISKPSGPTPDPNLSPNQSEQEFDDSGQAKAIERETDLWQFYDNPDVGISFNYPHEMILGENIKIDLEDMGQGAGPMRLSKEEEMETVMALTSGEFGKNSDFVFELSKKVPSVGFLFAQDFLVLSRFEICNVTLERKLNFYFNNKKITITSIMPTNLLKEKMPEYFYIDELNCAQEKIWDLEKQEEFYQKLEEGQAPLEIQQWYDDFEKISGSVIFAHR